MFWRIPSFVVLAVFAAAIVSLAQTGQSDRFETLVAGAQNAQAAGNFSLAANNYREAVKISNDIP